MLDQIIQFTISNPLSALNSFICSAIFYHGVCLLNSRKFPWTSAHAWGYKILTVGAFATAIGPLYGYTYPEIFEVLVDFGVLIVAAAVVYRKLYRKPKDETPT